MGTVEIKVVLKNKDGKVTRELSYPPEAVRRLLKISKQWQLADNSDWQYVGGVLKPRETKTYDRKGINTDK